MLRIYFFAVLSCFFVTNLLLAQAPSLTAEEAVQAALKNNYSVLISRNDVAIAHNDATKGNAGMLPQLTATLTDNVAANNAHTVFATGIEQNRTIALSNGLSASIAFNWTIFDGWKMYATYTKLKELESLGSLNLQSAMETTVAQTLNAYYNIVQQQEILRVQDRSIALSQERLVLAEKRLAIGNGTQSAVLQAQVDLNAQQSAGLKQLNLIANAQVALNRLMMSDLSVAMQPKDSLTVVPLPDFGSLQTAAHAHNLTELQLQKGIRIAELTEKETESLKYPRIGLGAAYNFNRTDNQAGVTSINQTNGLTAGVSASWNLYNGGNVKRQIADSKIALETTRLRLRDAQATTESNLLQAYNRYQNALQVLLMEQQNQVLAQQSASIMQERYRAGEATVLEWKDVQRSLEDASSRLVYARYDAKTAEIEVQRLTGGLLK